MVEPVRTVQRAPVDVPQSAPASSPARPSEPLVQRAVETPAIQPVSHRDPRILARKIETTRPIVQSDLPLSPKSAMAVLPQARLASSPTADAPVQRSSERGVVPNLPGMAAIQPVSATGFAQIQRSPEPKISPQPKTLQERPRTQQVISRSPSSVRRASLPLAKLRTVSSKPTVQRDDDEVELEGQVSNSPRGEDFSSEPQVEGSPRLGVQDEGMVSDPDPMRTNTRVGSSSQGNGGKEPKKEDTTNSPRVGSSSQGNSGKEPKKEDTTITSTEPKGAPKTETPTLFQRNNPSFDPDEEIDDDDEEGMAKKAGPNLHVIARAIMPMVKHMLLVERERRTFR